MDRLKTYLSKRRKEILKDIETDHKINADNYSNVGRLKEIEKIIKLEKEIR